MKISKRLLENLILKMLKETADATETVKANDKLQVNDIFFKDEEQQNKGTTTK